MSGSLLLQSIILGLLLGGLYALLAAGLTLYFGVMRVVMIAHAAFLVLAAYLAWWWQTETGLDPLLSMLVTVPLFFGIGVLLQRLLLSRLRPATLTMMSVLLTFAIALVVEGMLGYVFSGTQRRIQLGYSGASLELFGAKGVPDVARRLGTGVREVKDAVGEVDPRRMLESGEAKKDAPRTAQPAPPAREPDA